MANSRSPSLAMTNSSSSSDDSGKSSVDIGPPAIGYVPPDDFLAAPTGDHHHAENTTSFKAEADTNAVPNVHNSAITPANALNDSNAQTSSSSAQAESSYHSFYFGPAPLPDPTTGELPTSVLARINPELNPQDDTIPKLVQRVLNPPLYLYNENGTQVTLEITWAVGVVGVEHFSSEYAIQRLFLRPESAFRRYAKDYGLPVVILDWLCNEPEEGTIELTVEQLKDTRQR